MLMHDGSDQPQQVTRLSSRFIVVYILLHYRLKSLFTPGHVIRIVLTHWHCIISYSSCYVHQYESLSLYQTHLHLYQCQRQLLALVQKKYHIRGYTLSVLCMVFDIKVFAEMCSRPMWMESLFAKFLLDITSRTRQEVSKLLWKLSWN